MKLNRLLALALFFCGAFLQAQVDGIKPLGGNSVLMHQSKKNLQKTLSDTLFLPFFDDFSSGGPYVDASRWGMSQSIYLNRTYPIAPPTLGVATFDGLNRDGYPYNINATSGVCALSDTLMSVPIRLDYTDASLTIPLTPADSVYLSFYYQMQGRGDMPEPNDVLSLFFFAPGDSLDVNPNSNLPVWTHSGSAYTLGADTNNFHKVIIPITDTAYFKNGFRFAFTNMGTQSGAIDHWHIDQIYLNKGRTYKDTVYPDISFVYNEKSLLKNYMQMPFNQFAGSADMRDSVPRAFLRNNNNTKNGNTWNGQVNLNTEYQILNNTGTQVALVNAGTNNVFNYDSIGYCKDPAIVKPSLGGYTYDTGPFSDTTSFLFKFYLHQATTNNYVAENDTISFRQNFQNYYAYDDGSAEGGYFVSAFGGETAVKYTLNVKDTLRALDIFFDPIFRVGTIQNVNIRLTLRNSNGGQPGTLIFMDSISYSHPVYNKTGHDVFQRYQLSVPQPLAAGITFFVGVWQEISEPLGIGFDLNNDTHQNIYYFNGSLWNMASYYLKGSLMIRPVFGDSLRAVGIEEHKTVNANVQVYPNPATNEVVLQSARALNKVTITDVVGNIVLEKQSEPALTQRINIAVLPNGLYLIKASDVKGSASTQKLLIAR